ncbi:chitosanase [Acrodontium crateriforme]|uniref:Endo-chitosanase n=1 Tax=Acrodontium crateriforme TaxID=150365 RepID=A0AAQ3LYG2_9PEZI|nr:chitosanase [Acrodontium crateriforme]
MKYSQVVTLAALAVSANARSVPTNVRNFINSVRNNGKGNCQHPLSGGFHSKDNDSDNFVYCADYSDQFMYLQGPNGQLVNMDIDCDGDQRSNRPGNDGRCGPSDDTQNETSFGYIAAGYSNSHIKELNAYVHTYVVLGNEDTKPSFNPKDHGIEPLSVVAVVCGDNMFYGVWGDENGNDGQPLVGEASLSMATLCYGKSVNGNSGHDDNDVMYIAFKGQDAVPGTKANWDAQSATDFENSLASTGDALIKRIGSNGGSSTPPTCSWAGHCTGASCSTDDDCSDALTCKSGKCA